MSWAWLLPLGVAAVTAAGFVALAGAARRETSRLRLARAELETVKPALRQARERRGR